MITYLALTSVLFLAMLVYFKIADRYNIIDHPNERSSHTSVTIRGGGIIFLFAAIIALIFHPIYWLGLSGILIIGLISFLDDVFTLSNGIRILFHLAAVTLMFAGLSFFSLVPVYVWLMVYIIVIGIINMYNFMDGINGITGTYSLVVLGGLQYVNLYQFAFIDAGMIWLPMLSCVVFLFFNFRKKAKCFAGDVGSVAIALWIVLLLITVILRTGRWEYILFLAVYGVDSVLTIAHRLILKQNIFKAHRFHLYQLLANEYKIPHLMVSTGYALVQLTIIFLINVQIIRSPVILFLLSTIPLAAFYMLIKPILMKTAITL